MKQRSFFGPLLLIAAGVVWLLIAMKVIPATNLWALGHILPYLLIALGLALILRARWTIAGWVMSAVVVSGAFLAVVFAPQLGWNKALPWGAGPEFSGAVPGSGKIEAETRKLNDFLAVSLEYPAEVLIQQSESYAVEIEAEDNLLPQLATEIRGGTLYIENSEPDWTKRVSPSKPVRITITVKDLREIILSSAATLQVDGLEANNLKLVISGASDVKLNRLQVRKLEAILSGAGTVQADGAADEIKVLISGLGTFEAPGLASLTAEIRLTGAGSATLRVKDELSATISGAGSVEYYGTPRIIQEISGAGSVRQAGQ